VGIDLSEFHALRSEKGPRCTFEHFNLGKVDAEALTAACLDQSITNRAISLWLRARGIEVTNHVIARHRRNECRCGKKAS
jgi:hypothetical protein